MDKGVDPGAFPDNALLALMTDAYWGRHDRYAAWLWRRIPLDRKGILLRDAPFLNVYVAYLVDVEEEYRPYEQEPYYLDPLPIHLMSTEDLTEVVRKEKTLLARLPSMRRETLKLRAPEFLALLADIEAAEQQEMPKLPDYQPSEARRIKRKIKISINSLEEEEEILRMQNLTAEQKADIPTLAWLAELPDEKIAEVLQDFMAQDLAYAWIGPGPVLERLSANLPPKKLALVQAYTERVRPDRDSAAFQRLFRRGAELRFSQTGAEQDGADDGVAA